jgi:hypothetical protein
MELSFKKYLLITIPIFAVVIFALLAYLNVGGIGTKISGVGGPFAAGFQKLLIGPLTWASAGGWPTLAIFYLVGLIAIPFSFAYIIWHYDVPYKITGATAPSPASTYDNSMKREPDEPERSSAPAVTK